ncbi:MAG TPA: hydroxymethylglutaryl-CoA lyase [Pseudonocardia sp.]
MNESETLWDAPRSHCAGDLPAEVSVYEVGARDGLQAESAVLSSGVKVAFVGRLVAAGLRAIEVSSFVSPRRIPQLADAEEVLAALDLDGDVRFPVLVPNLRGLERAMACDVREIAIFVSATETFARRNLNTSLDGALDMARPVVERANAAGMNVRGYVSMCFGDPWEGYVEPRTAAGVVGRVFDLGCSSVSIGDTIGVATPGAVGAVLKEIRNAKIEMSRLAMHFHDTYGQALVNIREALSFDVREFDASAGGLGGCPYAKSATGNVATEDLVWMLHGLGVRTNVDLMSLVRTSVWMARHLGHPSPSRVVAALANVAGQRAET